jgi:hypothetical protein
MSTVDACVGAGRSSVRQTDWHKLEEQRFAEQVAPTLERIVRERGVEALVVVAPPRALADLRRAFHPDVKKKIIAEIDKDLTKHPVDQIEKHLAAATSLSARRGRLSSLRGASHLRRKMRPELRNVKRRWPKKAMGTHPAWTQILISVLCAGNQCTSAVQAAAYAAVARASNNQE